MHILSHQQLFKVRFVHKDNFNSLEQMVDASMAIKRSQLCTHRISWGQLEHLKITQILRKVAKNQQNAEC